MKNLFTIELTAITDAGNTVSRIEYGFDNQEDFDRIRFKVGLVLTQEWAGVESDLVDEVTTPAAA